MLAGVALAALLLLPSSSLGAQDAADLSGVITRVPNGVKIAITNNGPDPAAFIWIEMPATVKHTSASADQGGGCAAGGDAHTVRCTWGTLAPGQTRTVTIMTNVPYPAGAGAQLYVSQFFNSAKTPAGEATGPPPLPPCKCKSLTARLAARSLDVDTDRDGDVKLRMRAHWALTCSSGGGGCDAELRMQAPQQRTNARTGDRGYSTWWETAGFHAGRSWPISCRGECAKKVTDFEDLTLGAEGLATAERASESIPIVIRRKCQGKALPPVRLSIAFDRNGKVDLKKSKLG